MIVPFIAVGRYVLNNKSNGLPTKTHLCTIVKNQVNLPKFPEFSNNYLSQLQEHLKNVFPVLKRENYILVLWTKHLPQVSKALTSSSVSVARNCLKQIEYVAAQRVRRGQQMISLYTRLWDEKGLRLLFLRLRRMLHKKSNRLILGASLLAFDWEDERIPIDDLKRHINEMRICHILRRKVFTGEEGEGTQSFCTGKDCPCPECDAVSDVHCWEPFIKEEDLTVWKMEETHHKGSGLYCYKMYGKYSDVTANDFLEVFLDTENRTKWDVHAADLKVIDSDPSSNSDVIYWETKWPMMFSNRDYVFKRRYYKDVKNKVIVIMNRSTTHHLFPPSSSKARVSEFWSYMVIKANTDFSEPGIEFSLTYFDNPGISLPSAITLWVTVQGMPEYLKRLRVEALAISEKRKLTQFEDDEEEEDSKPGIKDSSVNTGSSKTSERSPPKRECQTDIPPSPPSDHEPQLTPADLIFIFSSYMQKLKSSLWL